MALKISVLQPDGVAPCYDYEDESKEPQPSPMDNYGLTAAVKVAPPVLVIPPVFSSKPKSLLSQTSLRIRR